MILQHTALSDFLIAVGLMAWGFIVVHQKATWVKVAAPKREFLS